MPAVAAMSAAHTFVSPPPRSNLPSWVAPSSRPSQWLKCVPANRRAEVSLSLQPKPPTQASWSFPWPTLMPPYQGCCADDAVIGDGGFDGCCANTGAESMAATSAAERGKTDFIDLRWQRLNSTI